MNGGQRLSKGLLQPGTQRLGHRGMLHEGPAEGQVSSKAPSWRTVDFHENWQKWNPEITYLRSSYIELRTEDSLGGVT